MTDSTRESKAKYFVIISVKELVARYSETKSNMNLDLGDGDDKIAHLEMMINKLKNKTTPVLDQIKGKENEYNFDGTSLILSVTIISMTSGSDVTDSSNSKNEGAKNTRSL